MEIWRQQQLRFCDIQSSSHCNSYFPTVAFAFFRLSHCHRTVPINNLNPRVINSIMSGCQSKTNRSKSEFIYDSSNWFDFDLISFTLIKFSDYQSKRTIRWDDAHHHFCECWNADQSKKCKKFSLSFSRFAYRYIHFCFSFFGESPFK